MFVKKQYMANPFTLAVLLAFAGCGVGGQDMRNDVRGKYVEYLREIIADAKKDPPTFSLATPLPTAKSGASGKWYISTIGI